MQGLKIAFVFMIDKSKRKSSLQQIVIILITDTLFWTWSSLLGDIGILLILKQKTQTKWKLEQISYPKRNTNKSKTYKDWSCPKIQNCQKQFLPLTVTCRAECTLWRLYHNILLQTTQVSLNFEIYSKWFYRALTKEYQRVIQKSYWEIEFTEQRTTNPLPEREQADNQHSNASI